jgi:ribonuclease-3
MSDDKTLAVVLGHEFRDPKLLTLALTHSSVAHEQGVPAHNNERLEFLGDAVLQFILTRELYHTYPVSYEGSLTKARALMVNEETLAQKARELGLGEHLILSKGEEKQGGRGRPKILCDVFEAVLGAIFLDGGIGAAERFVMEQFADSLDGPDEIPAIGNPKGELQEMMQAVSPAAPQYYVISVSGPDHDRVFECAVRHEGRELARGTGKSKKAAEKSAALAALESLKKKT